MVFKIRKVKQKFDVHQLSLAQNIKKLTFDFEHLQRIVCDVMKLCAKFERNRTIRGGVIAISVFDLMALNMFRVLRSALK